MSEPTHGTFSGPPKLRPVRQEVSDDGRRVRLTMDSPAQWGGVIELPEPIQGRGEVVVVEVVWPSWPPVTEQYTLPRRSVITSLYTYRDVPPLETSADWAGPVYWQD